MNKAVIFDMDGVIFDSEAMVLACWKNIAETYGISGIDEVFCQCIGTNSAETKRIIKDYYGEDFEYDRFREKASALFQEKTKEKGVPVTVVCGDMVTHSKPHPEIYELACSKMGLDPAGTYAIEDSFHGVRAASAAGMRVIMVPDLIAPDKEIEALAWQIYPSLMGVLGLFQSF